ncbi:MAG TPA: hypothetical protein VNZ22_01905 [Bacillota bacterium]|nr:hypothetical protein [Bacillota bacterium]
MLFEKPERREQTLDARHAPGNYPWSVVSPLAGVSTTNTGSITISAPVIMGTVRSANLLALSWSQSLADVLLEQVGALDPSVPWQWVTNAPAAKVGGLSVTLPIAGQGVFRFRRPW